jgi:stage V sporulation protein AA
VKADQNMTVKDTVVKLQDVVTLYCVKKDVVKTLNSEFFYNIQDTVGKKTAFSILKVYEVIHRVYPDITIENLGEEDFLVEYQPQQKPMLWWEYTKVVFASLLLFFGAAFTIMTFNEDVAVHKVFDKVFELIMGYKKEGGSALEVCYAIGIPLGVMVFYNHFRSRKMKDDPTPIQVEMRTYEEQENKAMIRDASREGENIDCN